MNHFFLSLSLAASPSSSPVPVSPSDQHLLLALYQLWLEVGTASDEEAMLAAIVSQVLRAGLAAFTAEVASRRAGDSAAALASVLGVAPE